MIPNAIEITLLVLSMFLIVALMNVHHMSAYLARLKLGVAADGLKAPTHDDGAEASDQDDSDVLPTQERSAENLLESEEPKV